MAGWETTHHNKYLIALNLFFIFSIIQKKRNKITYSITYNIKTAKLKKKILKTIFSMLRLLTTILFYILLQYYFPREADVNNSYDIIHNATLLRG